ncbi:M56 family metallopeptidase [Gryllotalpicola ginsengisoli]|uniref:M56 family metallopeptidase n=1 Tax=Gryllotalpicola ginsengisoli TaxID=444608 RepID=UPI0003B2E430|nr:M56 family metallopeptidase [Gryllotalpicola ginsengisoli]
MLIHPISLGLGAVAVLLAWPVPIALARARWTLRRPVIAMVCWQGIAVAGGFSMIGALWSLSRGAAVLLALHLLLNLGLTAVGTSRQRRRHRQLVELLSSPMPDRPNTRLIENEAPVAYCLPGAPRSVTVLSDGLVRLLSDDELAAVVAHERAHVTQHHHVVLMAFKAWHTALPWFPIASRAEEAVALLVELLADDDARQVVPDEVLASAVERVAGTDASSVAPRLARLSRAGS